MLWINVMAYLITNTLICSGYTPAIISKYKTWNFFHLESSTAKNVSVTELRHKSKVLFNLNFQKGFYEFYSTKATGTPVSVLLIVSTSSWQNLFKVYFYGYPILDHFSKKDAVTELRKIGNGITLWKTWQKYIGKG